MKELLQPILISFKAIETHLATLLDISYLERLFPSLQLDKNPSELKTFYNQYRRSPTRALTNDALFDLANILATYSTQGNIEKTQAKTAILKQIYSNYDLNKLNTALFDYCSWDPFQLAEGHNYTFDILELNKEQFALLIECLHLEDYDFLLNSLFYIQPLERTLGVNYRDYLIKKPSHARKLINLLAHYQLLTKDNWQICVDSFHNLKMPMQQSEYVQYALDAIEDALDNLSELSLIEDNLVFMENNIHNLSAIIKIMLLLKNSNDNLVTRDNFHTICAISRDSRFNENSHLYLLRPMLRLLDKKALTQITFNCLLVAFKTSALLEETSLSILAGFSADEKQAHLFINLYCYNFISEQEALNKYSSTLQSLDKIEQPAITSAFATSDFTEGVAAYRLFFLLESFGILSDKISDIFIHITNFDSYFNLIRKANSFLGFANAQIDSNDYAELLAKLCYVDCKQALALLTNTHDRPVSSQAALQLVNSLAHNLQALRNLSSAIAILNTFGDVFGTLENNIDALKPLSLRHASKLLPILEFLKTSMVQGKINNPLAPVTLIQLLNSYQQSLKDAEKTSGGGHAIAIMNEIITFVDFETSFFDNLAFDDENDVYGFPFNDTDRVPCSKKRHKADYLSYGEFDRRIYAMLLTEPEMALENLHEILKAISKLFNEKNMNFVSNQRFQLFCNQPQAAVAEASLICKIAKFKKEQKWQRKGNDAAMQWKDFTRAVKVDNRRYYKAMLFSAVCKPEAEKISDLTIMTSPPKTSKP